MTAQDLVNAALTLIGRLGAGRGAGPVESAISFAVLQDMLISLGLQRTMIYQVVFNSYPLTATQLSGTLGPGGSLGTARPVYIDHANAVLTLGTATLREPVKLIDAKEFSEIPTQGDLSVWPKFLYDDYGFPLSTLYLNPMPQVNMNLELWTWQPLQVFVALTDAFAMPPGYFRALKDALAMELSPVFKIPISKELVLAAKDSMGAIVANNLRMPQMPPPAAAPPAPAQQG